jgi:hypothetical protein
LGRSDITKRARGVIVGGCGQRTLWALLVLWLASAATGLTWLMAYDNTPGTPANAPSGWPAGSMLARDAAGPTLVMLAHPRCDCTRASIGELAELLARAPRRPRTFVVFVRPGGVPTAWEQTGTFDRARRILRSGPVVRPGWATGVFRRYHRRSGKVRQQHRTLLASRIARRGTPAPRDHSGLRLLSLLVVDG